MSPTAASRSLLFETARQVARKWREADGTPPRVIGLQAAEADGIPPGVEIDGTKYRVVFAPGVLDARTALIEAEESGEALLLVTPHPSEVLGRDAVARFAGARLVTPELFETAGALFGARTIDLGKLPRDILNAVVGHVPPGGFSPVAAGVLGPDAVWQAFFEHVLRLPGGIADLPALLSWSLDSESRARFEALDKGVRKKVLDRTEASAGDGAALLLQIVHAGNGSHAFAAALVCEILYGDGGGIPEDAIDFDPAAISEARVRAERLTGGEMIEPPAGTELGLEVRAFVREVVAGALSGGATTPPASVRDLDRALDLAERLVDELRLSRAVSRSSLLRRGFEARLAACGKAAIAAVRQRSSAAIERAREALRRVEEHRMAHQDPAVVERARCALRLATFLALPDAEDGPLAEIARRHILEGSFVDRAREALAHGERHEEAAQAYIEIARLARERQQSREGAFVTRLANWLEAGGGSDVIGVEDVLDRIVAPIARKTGVLVVLLDGLDWSIAGKLIADMTRRRRAELVWPAEAGQFPAPVLSTLPSVTECARASFFAGKLARGDAAFEARGFAEHRSLLEAGHRGHPPILFHKRDISRSEHGAIGDEVTRAIGDAQRRVVAVVVNTIDDHLDGADQIRHDWSEDVIAPLGGLLESAFDAGRVVVIASDHGHVLHEDGESFASSGPAARWRPAAGRDASQGELRVRGARVLLPQEGGEIVVLARSGSRYGLPRRGYHGGATPQEMLTPVFALARPGREPVKGLELVDFPEPAWWRIEGPMLLAPEPAPAARADSDTRPTVAPVPALSPSWIDELFASEMWSTQIAVFRRQAPRTEDVRRTLDVLHRAGGSLTIAGFAQAVDLPTLRVAGFLAGIRRALNVDGYAVLGFDETRDRVELDLEMLRQQFGLG